MRLINKYKILKIVGLIILCVFFLYTGCSNHKDSGNSKFDPDTKFIYVLQNIGIKELENTEFEIAIVDPDDSKINEGDLEKLHREDKVLLAYLSIGEAENYRDYWEDSWEVGNPVFIDSENPDWEGNYKVQYWNDEWQKIIFHKLNQIIDLGYDGIYLDVIDAYEYYERNGMSHAKEKMIDFVISISKRSKEKNSNIIIIPQNSEELLLNEEYLSAIDGIGREDLWYLGDKPQEKEELEAALYYLEKVLDSKKFVLAVSYPSEKNKKCNFIKSAKQKNLIPYAGKTELNTIEIINCD
jgi:cysteinyl-tRNA synthetase, unknown class